MLSAIKKPHTTTADELGIGAMRTLYDAPTLAPLAKRRREIRARLEAIRAEIVQARRALYHAEGADSFGALTTRRQITAAIEALEEEGADLETALDAVNTELAAQETRVKGELQKVLAREGLPVAQALRQALAQLGEAGAAYSAFIARTSHLLTAPIVSAHFDFSNLKACITRAEQVVERLQRLRDAE